MKKTISIILLLFCAVAGYAQGIGTYKELLEFAAASNSGQNIDKWKDADGVICLTADIDMSKVKKFEGVKSFGGIFDGCGFSIMNWKAQRGLFGQIAEGGIVRNLKIDASCSMKVSNGTVENIMSDSLQMRMEESWKTARITATSAIVPALRRMTCMSEGSPA